MIFKDVSLAESIQPKPGFDRSGKGQSDQLLVTLFAIPKPFAMSGSGHSVNTIQRNAIKSWSKIPGVEVLLLGDESGIGETAAELGVRHVPGLDRNRCGTPLISSAFQLAQENSDAPFLAYCNCDVILLPDFSRTIQRIADWNRESFVAFGRRTDLNVEQEIDFDSNEQLMELVRRSLDRGRKAPVVCKEYFVFPRNVYRSVPAFAVGRGNWDNWMIYSAKQKGHPVVDVTDSVTAIHQTHDYRHTSSGRWNCYVAGDEAKENERLAGGKHIIAGSTPTHRVTQRGIRKVALNRLNLAFWADIPRFLRLVLDLLASR